MVSLASHPDQEELLAGSRKAQVVPVVWILDGTKSMVDSVLQDISEGQVEDLHIDLFRIPTTIDPDLLSKAVTKVESCEISGGQSGQLGAILGAVSEAPDIVLKSIYLDGVEVAEISPEILAGAAVRLTRLYLGDPTSGQVGEILNRLASTADNKLRDFQFFCDDQRDLSHLRPETVSDALLKLEDPGDILQYVLLPPGQMNNLMTKMKDSEEDLGFTNL